MGPDLSDILKDVRAASENISRGEARTRERFDAIEQSTAAIEKSVNELYLKANRPGGFGSGNGSDIADFERKDARELCILKHDLDVPKNDGHAPAYQPTSAEIDAAMTHRKALKSLFRHGDPARLDPLERKSLTSFSFGTNGFILAPQMSNTVLSCLVDEDNISGLVDNQTISAGSIRFFIDNSRMEEAAFACEASCFANNPQPDLQEGLGELEIKAETLRFVACAGSDLLQDASFNIEAWLFRKVAEGFRRTINRAILIGDGIGKPLGLLNPQAGIPIAETSPSTPPGQFSWQDLVMLKWEIPQQWHDGAVFVMNQRTFALLLTMTDATSRPIMVADPTQAGRKLIEGSPVIIANFMPDVVPGSLPVLFGNLRKTYTLVTRRATTMVTDPYSAGWCTLFKFDARCGGATTCPNASRLLRIK